MTKSRKDFPALHSSAALYDVNVRTLNEQLTKLFQTMD